MRPLKTFPTLLLLLLVFLPVKAICQFLPGDSAPRAAAGNQSSAQIGSSGNGYLVAWTDTRSVLASQFLGTGGPYSGTGLGTMTDIYAARLDASGALLDTVPIVVTEATYNQINPLVGWNGQNYLVVWMTERADNRYYSDVMAARVTPEGVVMDNPPLLLKGATTANDEYTPWSISSDGTNWAVAYRSLDTTTNVYTIDGLRVAPDGSILDPGGKRLREDFWNSGATNANLAFAGNEYLLSWAELNFTTGTWLVKGQLLSTSLDLIGTVFPVDLLTVTSPQSPSSASDGNGFFVTWFENRYFGFAQIYGTRVSHTGQVLDQTGIAVTGPAGYTQFAPDVSWDGFNYIVSYNKEKTGFNEDIFITRVSNSGKVLDSSGILVKAGSANQNQPGIAPAPGGGAHVVWTDLQAAGPNPQDIGTAFISGAGTAGASSTVSQGAPRQRSPRLAGGAGEFLAVFRSEISGESRIFAERVDPSGNSLDLEPILIAGGTATALNPAVGFNGTVFLAVWEDSGNVYGRRVRPDGAVLDGTPLLIMAGSQPDVAALGDTFLIVADAAPINPQYRFIFAARLASTGAVLSAPLQVSSSFAVSPRVTMLGSRWLVVWENHPTHDDPTSVIQGAFVNADGTPWGAFLVSSRSYDETPAVASAGGSALIAWADADIFGRRILSDGTLLDTASGIVISNAPGDQFEPAVAWDGTEFLLDWLDQRNDPYPNQVRGDIYGARVDSNGNVLDPTGFAVANSPLPEEDPAVVAGNGTAFFAYAAYHDTGYAAFRIVLRQFPFSATPACSYALSPASGSFPAAGGGTGAFNILTTAGCSWTAVSNTAWTSITSSPSGTGPATVTYSVLANTSTASRSGTISAAGQIFTVSQSGVLCSYAISPTSQSIAAAGGAGTVTVTTSAGCTWSASSNAPWITITSATSGSGSGGITYSAIANNSTTARTGTITVAGQLFTVGQPPLLFTVFGNVITSKGSSLAKVTLTFAVVSGAGPAPASVQTDSNGGWQQTGFRSGTTYSVTPSRWPYKFTPSSRTFTDGSTALNFVGSR
jgi:Viral BACON domain